MSKSLLNLLVQISKALVNSKIKFLIQNNLSSSLLARLPLPAHSAFGLAGPAGPLLPQDEAQPTWPLSRSAHACRWRISPKTFSSLIHAFRSWRLLSIPSLTHGPHLSAPSSPRRRPTPAMSPPRRRSCAAHSAPQDAAEPLPPPITPLNPPSNRALTSLNGLNGHSPLSLLRPPLRCPPPAP
jgi:hypothetical protein